MKKLFLIIILMLFSTVCAQGESPYLKKTGYATQLMVDRNPFLILGGELGNSSFTSLKYMSPVWPKLVTMHLNTVLAPVYWELIEPVEGQFDFQLYNKLIGEARKHNLKLVLLWFGSWKNSMSSYAPGWIKTDQDRFPRAKDDTGKSQEILTPFSENNLQADLKAFQALMGHIKEIDENDHTILMIQPENEIGMLPTARDYHPLANARFNEPVPAEFTGYLEKHKAELVPEFRDAWEKNGFKTAGTWEDIFGKGVHTDEIFMAWYFAKYTDRIAAAGKEIYPIPMYVNAALNRPGKLPGTGYPSAGPLPHLMDVWKAGAPAIDFLAPDFYFPDLKHWSDHYTRQENPLFIPEHQFDNSVAAKAVYAIGHYEAIGFSPFSIESAREPENEPLGKVYDLIGQLTPVIAKYHGQHRIEGILLDKENQESVIRMGDYEFTVKHSDILGYEANAKNDAWETAGALLIQTKDNEFYLTGSGVVITFKNLINPEVTVGILRAEEGVFENNEWKVIRYLNGDQTHQGRHIRIFLDDYSIQRFELYNYR